ncbi:hypothetical protein [Amorphus orientalis]|uniref:Uncharacterized protein n=1 Tax=Amorphus orientalis TaxID=649198 RepID=A0AAE3VPL6_9HYPH|nr:hypothetical protein [Amorphus orientalis]MDQ0315708.1 hypothetical protein [Amorphus orientalis]
MPINNSSEFISQIRRNPENFYIIHYSCQSLYDDNDGLPPRITSIAISHFATEQAVSFSTHSIAEELHISRENVRDEFDNIEKKLLIDFYEFVRNRRDKYWVHWNMRNLTYGFEHLEHRYRVLGSDNAPVIPVERRINLNDLLSDRYGSEYAPHPKLTSLMDLNGGIHRHALTGKEEVEVFEKNEFIKMHNSTLAKVGFFHLVIKKLIHGKLRTAARSFGVKLDRLFESRLAKMVGLIATTLTIIAVIRQIIMYFI